MVAPSVVAVAVKPSAWVENRLVRATFPLPTGVTAHCCCTKHHDGFALWPTKYGTQNVMNSGYKRDVVRQYVDSFRSRGLKAGFYFSIWDRTYPVQATGGYQSATRPRVSARPRSSIC